MAQFIDCIAYLTPLIDLLTLIAIVFYVWKTFTMANAAVSTARHVSASLSNQHNWELLKRWPLPAALPSWKSLTAQQFTWRTLHLNHLNLLLLVHEDRKKYLRTRSEFRTWEEKGQYWFQHLGDTGADPDGWSALEQLIKPEEGYPLGFRQWLFDKIIPQGLFEGRKRPDV